MKPSESRLKREIAELQHEPEFFRFVVGLTEGDSETPVPTEGPIHQDLDESCGLLGSEKVTSPGEAAQQAAAKRDPFYASWLKRKSTQKSRWLDR